MSANDHVLPGLSVQDMLGALMSGLTLGDAAGRPDAGESDYDFVRRHQLSLDGALIAGEEGLGTGDTGDYKHLRGPDALYEDDGDRIVVMAGAQSGKSVWLMVHLARALLLHWGKQFGYYFPDQHLPRQFSNTRFRPFLRSNRTIGRLLGAPIKSEDGTATKGRDATESLTLGASYCHFMTIGGKTATEGMPLKGAFFDEVRRMALGDIERAQLRYSAQVDPLDVKVSTARYPESDIHRFYLEGDQRKFHTMCDCADGCVLTDTFPNCLVDVRHATQKLRRAIDHAYVHAGIPLFGLRGKAEGMPDAVYMCPTCGKVLVDPRDGWWEPHVPGRAVHSYQMSKMLTVTTPAPVMLHAFEKSDDQQEFFNSWVGIPFVDRDKMPLQLEDIDACVDTSLEWGRHMTAEQRRRRLPNCVMGIDQQAGWATCVVKWKTPSDKGRVVHVEVLENLDDQRSWWHRAAQLMHEYDVRFCVVDEAPDFTGSLQFANAFPGRVFLANFNLGENVRGGPIQWEDQRLAKDKKQHGDTQMRHRVSMERARAVHWGLMRWKKRVMEMPDPRRLVQVLPVDSKGKVVWSAHLKAGVRSPALPVMAMREQLVAWVFRDLIEADPQSTPQARSKAQIAQRRGKKKWVAEALGDHNDLSMADLYASVALDRAGRPMGVRGIE